MNAGARLGGNAWGGCSPGGTKAARGSGGAPGAPPAGSGAEPQHSWLGGLGERYELPQWGSGRSPDRQRIWCIVEA